MKKLYDEFGKAYNIEDKHTREKYYGSPGTVDKMWTDLTYRLPVTLLIAFVIWALINLIFSININFIIIAIVCIIINTINNVRQRTKHNR